jgi:class 3 adenylate cyclase
MEAKFYDVVGDTVNTAKRIENAAERCEVLISEAAQRALGNAAIVGTARQLVVKGKDEPVVVYPLLSIGEFLPLSSA